ncbi:MAG TPA: PEP-CTERM sorting domain-containing protein [Methylophilus sp.]|uniref:PEP-CTERM sorting domain-containing protein n=1 Tax=Methylophilus sp. TaxID=29541 RepID=UPI002C41B8CF|nr:PEP-CTERM sorting domain-containing protein [Methylophilus sp.]HSH87293.1 PEP-CTERM sorting domain-containing protein [Methylophilus sp.]
MSKQQKGSTFSKALRYSLLTTVLGLISNAEAAAYNVYGKVNFSAQGSEIANPTGQSIVAALVNQYASFSATVDTSVLDSDSSNDVFLLNTAVTSTASIGAFNFGTDSNSCFSVQFDCKVESKINFPTESFTFDNQFITSQMMTADALGANSRLNFYYSTVGYDLFDTAQLIDPFAGTLSVGFSVFYRHDNQFQRINFDLSNITATPVPEPATSAMFGASLLMLGFLTQQRKKPTI